MATEPRDLGAVVVAGNVKFEVLEHDAGHVKLRNIEQADQYVLIDLEALTGIASILSRVARDCGRNRRRPPDREVSGATDLLV